MLEGGRWKAEPHGGRESTLTSPLTTLSASSMTEPTACEEEVHRKEGGRRREGKEDGGGRREEVGV